MKITIFFIVFLFSCQVQSTACRCNCGQGLRQLCAPSYELDNPCPSFCKMQVGKTACPTKKVYNPLINAYEWRSYCFSR